MSFHVVQNRSQTVHSEHALKWRFDTETDAGVETHQNGLTFDQAFQLKRAAEYVATGLPAMDHRKVAELVVQEIPFI